MERTSRQTQCPVSKNTPALHYRAKAYSALSFDRINFFTDMANLFLFSRKAFVMSYCFRAPIKAFFFDACRMTIKSCVLHLFPVPRNRKRPYNKHLISLVFSVRTVNYGSRAAGGIIGSFIHKFVCCCEWAKPVIQNHFSFKTCAILSVSLGKVNFVIQTKHLKGESSKSARKTAKAKHNRRLVMSLH